MASAIFAISIISGGALIALSFFSMLTNSFQFWPPPSKNTWQYSVFWLLFRVMFIGLITLCFFDFNSLGSYSNINFIIGTPLILIGFGSAIYSTYFLGWKNAHGESTGLKTSGLYKWSRNPIYVLSIIGMVGIGITINSTFVYGVLIIWTLMYIIAPFLEEPWLKAQYGQEYESYKSCTPRFIGFGKQKT